MKFRILAICIFIFSIFFLALVSFSQKQVIIVEKYYQERNLTPVFYHLNR